MRTLLVGEHTLGHITHMQTIAATVPAGEELSIAEIAPERTVLARWPMTRLHRNYALHVSLMAREAVQRSADHDTLIVHTQTAALLLPRRAASAALIVSSDGTPRNYDSVAEGYDHAASLESVERLKAAVWGRTYRAAGKVVAFSHWAAESMVRDYGVQPRKVVVIAPGTRVQPYDRRIEDDAKCRVLFVGGDFRRKGGHLLLDAVRDLPACSVDIVTRSEVPPQNGVTVHHGVHPGDGTLEKLMAKATVMVLPTLADMYSLASIEAMAAGLPVITTRVGGIPDIVVDGETGFLLEPGDVAAIRAAISALSAHPERARAMGRAAWERASTQFNAVRQTKALFDLGAELHATRSRRPGG